MARAPRSVGVALVLTISAQIFLQASQLFVTTSLTPGPRIGRASHVARRAEDEGGDGEGESEGEDAVVKMKKRGWKYPSRGRKRIRIKTPYRGIDLDGDKLDNLDAWYKEGIRGRGGPPRGFMEDLVLRSYFGTYRHNGFFKMSRDYTGPENQPSATDFQTAYENLKANCKENKHHYGQDDGKGWIWLTAGQNPGGLYLYTTKSPPYGERPLALIKESNVDEFFDKVDWHMLFVRLHKWNLWGGKAVEFPYPMTWRADA
eukprot:TRINITY_DN5737_c0_g1_i3.p1 TRINITY_DN5737_c0_g1~~TRINITY_DN5737_c0_g1_i3.p1  ORF type:complete len:276 (+),score=40.49 TRINITY_DN5737_c0_g1_i3:52-828(+)